MVRRSVGPDRQRLPCTHLAPKWSLRAARVSFNDLTDGRIGLGCCLRFLITCERRDGPRRALARDIVELGGISCQFQFQWCCGLAVRGALRKCPSRDPDLPFFLSSLIHHHVYFVNSIKMADEDSLVLRRSRRSTAGNR